MKGAGVQPAPATGPTREVVCPHCGRVLSVARRAMSTTCAACYKGVTLGDVTVRGIWSGLLASGGNVIVARGGVVAGGAAPNARGLRVSGDVDVEGAVRGDVAARGSVHVGTKATLEGCVEAVSLVVEPGGRLVAPRVRIGAINAR